MPHLFTYNFPLQPTDLSTNIVSRRLTAITKGKVSPRASWTTVSTLRTPRVSLHGSPNMPVSTEGCIKSSIFKVTPAQIETWRQASPVLVVQRFRSAGRLQLCRMVSGYRRFEESWSHHMQDEMVLLYSEDEGTTCLLTCRYLLTVDTA